jgi:predicted nicotinamide N-methyase
LKPLPWIARQASGPRQARHADAFAEVQRRLGVLFLGLEDGLGSQLCALAHAEEGRLLVHQRAGRAGQDALHRVAGEIAGLLARIDVGHADTDAVDQVGQLDRLHRADLHALAALDARGQEILFVERPGRPQALGPGIHQRQEARQRGARHARP